ncbi:MAG: hypothetical protein U9N56_01480 [Actinomycetota bacterium]|nr:hypothetical protein [Actinomycetota bacterium]
MSVMCELAAPFVANSSVDESEVVGLFRPHVQSCLKCQARHAAMAKTAREMTAMGEMKVKAPPDLEWRVMSSLEGDLAVARSWKAPIALAAALVSMAAAIVIWRFKPKTAG